MVPKKRNDSVASKSGPCNCNLWTFFFLFSTSVTVTPSTPCVLRSQIVKVCLHHHSTELDGISFRRDTVNVEVHKSETMTLLKKRKTNGGKIRFHLRFHKFFIWSLECLL